jgi:hypothetical protein
MLGAASNSAPPVVEEVVKDPAKGDGRLPAGMGLRLAEASDQTEDLVRPAACLSHPHLDRYPAAAAEFFDHCTNVYAAP